MSYLPSFKVHSNLSIPIITSHDDKEFEVKITNNSSSSSKTWERAIREDESIMSSLHYHGTKVDLKKGGKPRRAGRAHHGDAHQVVDHSRAPQQLHPPHSPAIKKNSIH